VIVEIGHHVAELAGRDEPHRADTETGGEDAVEKPCVCHLLKHGCSPARRQ
jgi:hypothetical protein